VPARVVACRPVSRSSWDELWDGVVGLEARPSGWVLSLTSRELVVRARGSSGRPVRSLAAAADVAGSTITRIQSGAVDPSVETRARVLRAAGFELQLGAIRLGTPPCPRLADLADAWTVHRGRLRVDWTRWRAFLDALALHPKLIPEAIYSTPPPAGDRVIDALLAAVAEKVADDAGLPRPVWAEHAPILAHPYRPPVARVIAGRSVPAQLAARGLMIDAESLWRDPERVGV
jgi:hypothetical protein